MMADRGTGGSTPSKGGYSEAGSGGDRRCGVEIDRRARHASLSDRPYDRTWGPQAVGHRTGSQLARHDLSRPPGPPSVRDTGRESSASTVAARSGPAIRALLAEVSPAKCAEFERDFAAAAEQAGRDVDIAPLDDVLDRWWRIAAVRGNRLTDIEGQWSTRQDPGLQRLATRPGRTVERTGLCTGPVGWRSLTPSYELFSRDAATNRPPDHRTEA